MSMKQIIDFCKKHNISEDQFYGREKISGDLYLRSVTSIPEGFNPTVGGYLYLRSGRRYIGATVNIEVEVRTPSSFFWKNNFALIDGIFCEVDNSRKCTANGEEYIVRNARRIGKSDVFFIVSKNDLHAHGNDFKEAFADLEFKIQSEKFKKEPITEDTLITVNHYRAITGACNMGCKDFLEKNKIPFTVNDAGNVVEVAPVKAKDLLILLKKDNSYGLSKFERFIQHQ